MARIGFSRNLGARADQAGLLVAAINAPTTFQRTLMPRPLADQAIVTGLSVASEPHVAAAMIAVFDLYLKGDPVAAQRLDSAANQPGYSLQMG